MALLKIREVCSKVGFGRTKIYEMIKNKKFLPGHFDGHNRRWKEEEVDAFRILYWGLDEALPDISEESLRNIKGYLMMHNHALCANRDDSSSIRSLK